MAGLIGDHRRVVPEEEMMKSVAKTYVDFMVERRRAYTQFYFEIGLQCLYFSVTAEKGKDIDFYRKLADKFEWFPCDFNIHTNENKERWATYSFPFHEKPKDYIEEYKRDFGIGVSC